MRVDLPSGNWIEFRDVMMRADIREARRGMRFITQPDGSRIVEGSFVDDVRGRIMSMMMTNWSWGPPLPRDCIQEHLQFQRLDTVLDDRDSLAADIAVQPWVDRIVKDPATAGTSYRLARSLVEVSISDPAQAQKALEAGDVLASDEQSPKALPSATGTVSPASPAPNGPGPTTDPTP